MNLPDVRTGAPILAEHIHRINAAIKQVQLRPGIGYFLRESSGGTSLVIPQGPVNSGGGTVTSAIPCPFECTNASTPEQLKVEVAWGLIWQMLPTGMFPDNDPTLKLDVSETCYIYSRITFNTNTLLPTAIDFSVETDLKQNTSSIQYNLIAVVTIDSEADPIVITSIRNICQQPFPSPCALSSA
jgi:hypothetical protein